MAAIAIASPILGLQFKLCLRITTAMSRTAVVNRDTNETKVQVIIISADNTADMHVKVCLSLDGGALPNSPKPADSNLSDGTQSGHATQATASQTIDVNTGIGFLDHVINRLTVTIADRRCSMLSQNIPDGLFDCTAKVISISTTTTPPKTAH